MLINKNLNLILLSGIFFLNILAMTPSLQDDNVESDEFLPALLRGFGFKSQKREPNHQVPRLISSSQVNQPNFDRINFAKSAYFVPGWADTRWQYRKNITIDHTKVDADLTNFPVYVELFDSDLQQDAQASGNDIMFSDVTGSILDHEIELYQRVYNSSHARLIAWIKINVSATQDTIISMYYGNPIAGNQENPIAVWDEDYVGVWHMKEDPSGSSPQIMDSTLNNNDGISGGSMTSDDLVSGQIDGSLEFDGANDNIATEENNLMAGLSSFTVSAWIKPQASQLDFCGIVEFDNTTDTSSFEMSMELRSTRVPRVNVWTTTGFNYLDSSTVLPTTSFTYFVFIYNGNLNIYLDGSFDDSTSHSGTIRNNYRYLNIGRNTHDGRTYNGIIDEVRISNVARSSEWIQTEYNNQYNPSSFYSISMKENYASGDEWAIPMLRYRKNVTILASQVSGSGTLANFPVLVDLFDTDLHSTDKVQMNGEDIVFADVDGTILYHEIELFDQTFNSTHGHLIAWVRVPSLSGTSNTTISMYYGNAAVGPQDNPEGVWDSNYAGVWHFTEATGGTDAIKDSTANNNDGTDYNNPIFGQTGKIYSAIEFDGTNQYLELPNSATLENITEGDYTYEAWFYADQVPPGTDPTANDKRYAALIKIDPHCGIFYDHDKTFTIEHWLTGPTWTGATSAACNPQSYYHLVGVVSKTDGYTKIYVNGTLEDTNTWTVGTDSHDYGIKTLKFGIANPGASVYRWCLDGKLDEMRVSKTARSANWISTEYNNQLNPNSFYLVETEEEYRSWFKDASFEFRKDILIDHTKLKGESQVLTLRPEGVGHVTFLSVSGAVDNWDAVNEVNYDTSTYVYRIQSGTYWGADYYQTENAPIISDSTINSVTIKFRGIKNSGLGAEGRTQIYTYSQYINGDSNNLGSSYANVYSQEYQANPYTGQAWTWTEINAMEIGVGLRGFMVADEARATQVWAEVNYTKSETLNNFPLLVDITSNDFKSSKIQPDASDLIFTDENGTKLFHEIEYFSQTSSQGHLIAWIEVNELFDNKDTLISMYYGNGELTSQESSNGVWSDNYVGVWHLSDSSGDAKDSTKYGTYGTLQSGATQGVTGKIDKSYNFDGQNEGVRIGNPSDGHLDFGISSFTISLWINVDQSTGTYQIPLYKGGTTSTSTGYEIETNTAATNLEIGISDGSTRINNQIPITFDTWIHFTGVIDRLTDTLRVYKNGVEIGTGNDISTIGDINNAYMMSFSQTSNPFDGLLDEIRISNSILSSSWIATEFTNQKNPSTFYTVGSETVFDKYPPEIIDFGVDDPGTGTGKFWADITDSTSGVVSAEVTINGTEHAMSYNGTYWIYQSSVNFGFNYNYSITNASDIMGNFLTSASSVKDHTFAYDAVAPDVLQWKYTTSTNTFRANVSDTWGEVDTVIVNVTSHSATLPDPPTQIMDFYQDFGEDGLGYVNDTLMMANGDIEFKIFVNDTSGNSFLSSTHPGVVWINHPPIAENLTLSPSPLYSNETLVLNYYYYDEDNHGESGTEIRWYKNGILQASFNDSPQIDDASLVPGDEWNVTVRPKDGELFGEINSSSTVTILNTPPIVQSVNLLPTTAYTTSTFSITNTSSDHENDELSFYIEWYWNSQHNTSYDNLLTITPDKTIKGESWYCRIRAFDGTSNSSWFSSDPVIIQNSIPQAVNLTISPSTAYTNDILVASWDMFDVDGDTENKSAAIIFWYKYGELQPLLNNCVSITSSNTSKDQSWFFRIQVFDGTDYSAGPPTQSGTRLISNSLPTAQNVSIIQSAPLTTDDLDANWDYLDLDNDIEGSPLIKWYTNSSGSWQHEASYNNYDTLPASATTKGQYWCFGIQVYDQDDYAAEVNSTPILILNTPPEVYNLDLTSNPTTTNDLVATWESDDNDSDSLTFYVTWFLNGILNTTLQTSGTSSTLTSENTTKNQEWSFNITAYDGETNSTEIALGYNITIQNSIPSVTNPTFNVTSPVAADEGFNITYGFVDADGDSEVVTNKLIVYWYVNWEYNATYVNYTEIDDIYTSTGEVWSYLIRVYDGEAYSANVSSVQGMTIGSRSNDPPYAENLTITPSTPKTHQNLIATYDYADNDSDPQYSYEISWYMNGTVQSEFNNQLTIPASATLEGQNWNFSIKVFDGIVWGIYYNSSLYTIINSPPKVDTLDLTASPTTVDDLVASWAFNDNDSDILTFNITWYLNGVLNSSWETTSSSTILKAGNTTKNDRWSFSIHAFDGDEYSNSVALGYNITILNTVPVVGNLTITTNPTTTDDLSANWDYYDLDDDPRDDGTAFIVWYLNGESVGGLENSSSVFSGNTTKNQVWWYTIQGYDGQNYSLLQESQHIQIQNTAPINSSSLPIPTNPTVETGLVLTESAILTSLFDADGDTMQFITSIRWFKESIIQPDLNGSLTVPGYELVKGEIWYYTILPSDGLDEGSLCVSSNILIKNSIPIVNLAYFIESSATTMQNLTSDFLYEDADGESISVFGIRWYRSTDTAAPYAYYLVPIYNGNLSLPHFATNKNERWKFDVKITDGYNESLNWILSDYIEIKNSKPWIDPFSISITGGSNTSDPLSLNYTWYDDDYPIDNETGTTITWENTDLESEPNNLLTLSSTFTKAGQRWWVTITPNDGEEAGIPIISWYYGKQITIGNTPPIITEASIQGVINATTWYGTSFGTNFDLVINYTVSDIDQDEGAAGYGIILVDNYLSEAKYNWFRNRSGVVTQILALEGETSVPFYNTEKGDVWWVQIRPRDLYGEYGLPFNSTQVIIGNTAPQILNLQWDQAEYRTANNLSFRYDFFDFDTDDTLVNVTIRWYLNGSYNPLYDNQNVISFLVIKKGQNWSAECMVYDGEAYSTWFSLPNITIQNTLPEVSSVILQPSSPNTAETLMAAWNYSDIDGDPEQQARIRWYKNSVLQPTLNDIITVLSGNTSKNELWYYTIEVFDAETYSVLVTSPVITIINTAPTLEDISFIMINPNTTISLGVDWTFLDLDGDTESTTVFIRWFKDGVNQSALDDSRVVSSSFTTKGEVWYYTVQVFDGQDYSISYDSIMITIDNAIPFIRDYSYEFNQTQSQVEPDVRHTLTELVFYVEGEPISISYEFLDHDLPLDSDQSRIYWYYYDNSTFYWVEEPLYRQYLTIPSSGASPGDRWQCVITPSDGLVDGQNITFPIVVIESKPFIPDNSPIISVLSDIEGHFELYLTATDLNNIITVEYLFNNSVETQYAQYVDDVWFLEFQLSIEDFQNYLDTNLTGDVKVTSTVVYGNQTFKIFTKVSFTLEVKDEAPPRVDNPYWLFNDELNPTNITFYADIIEYGSEISEVTLYYYFKLFEDTEISPVGIGASLLQSDSSEWRVVHMTLHNSTGDIPTYSITVPFDHNGTNREVIYRIRTLDSAGNSHIAYDIERDDSDRVGETRFIYQPPGLPEWILLVAGLAVFIIFVGSVVYVKFIRKPELVGLDKELVLNGMREVPEVDVMTKLDSHTIGVVVSFFDQRHGPIPIIVIPELLKDNFAKLVDLSDRSFSGTGFCDDFDTEIPSSYDFVLAQGLRTSVMSFGYALERPQARGGQENLTCNILVHQDVFPLVESFKEEIKNKVHRIHMLMNEKDSDKNTIRTKVMLLRKFVSSVILSYERIYGTTELIIEEN